LRSNLSLVRISCSVLIDFIRNYLEGTFVTPSVVPGVVDQPVVLAVFSALADDFAAFVVLTVGAGFTACRIHLLDVFAVLEGGTGHVMCALGHSLGVAGGFVTLATSADNTSRVEPVPRGSDLTSIASV